MNVLLALPLLLAADSSPMRVAPAPKLVCEGREPGAGCETPGGKPGNCVAEIVDTAEGTAAPRWEERLSCRELDDRLFRCTEAGAACRTMTRPGPTRKIALKLRGKDVTHRGAPPREVDGTCVEVTASRAPSLLRAEAGAVTGLACAPLVSSTAASAAQAAPEAASPDAPEDDASARTSATAVRIVLGVAGLIAAFVIGRSFFSSSSG